MINVVEIILTMKEHCNLLIPKNQSWQHTFKYCTHRKVITVISTDDDKRDDVNLKDINKVSIGQFEVRKGNIEILKLE